MSKIRMKTGIWLLCLGLSETRKLFILQYKDLQSMSMKRPEIIYFFFFKQTLEISIFLDSTKTIMFHFLLIYIPYL